MLLAPGSAQAATCQTETATFAYTGAEQCYQVPAGVLCGMPPCLPPQAGFNGGGGWFGGGAGTESGTAGAGGGGGGSSWGPAGTAFAPDSTRTALVSIAPLGPPSASITAPSPSTPTP